MRTRRSASSRVLLGRRVVLAEQREALGHLGTDAEHRVQRPRQGPGTPSTRVETQLAQQSRFDIPNDVGAVDVDVAARDAAVRR